MSYHGILALRACYYAYNLVQQQCTLSTSLCTNPYWDGWIQSTTTFIYFYFFVVVKLMMSKKEWKEYIIFRDSMWENSMRIILRILPPIYSQFCLEFCYGVFGVSKS
jgi:hypothetical protein